MKNLAFLCLYLLSTGFAYVPDRTVVPLIDIFNSRNKEVGADMRVQVTTFSKNGELKKNGNKIVINRKWYEHYKDVAGAVYRMQNKNWRGTAFHIGHNLVLTNMHVLNKNMSQRDCGDFKLLDRSEKDHFQCRKVHHCDPDLDVCLIEMYAIRKTKGCFLCKKENYIEAMSDGPAMKLSPRLPLETDSAPMTAIGNSKGLGIHVSQGRGFRKFATSLYFYAPIAGGNSGGPLLDETGHVVGVVKAETTLPMGNDIEHTYNVAASSDIVIIKIRNALKDDPETLEKFNESVVE